MLSWDWELRQQRYEFAIIGSGYGGAITAARIATAPLNPKPTICILERGKEWPIGSFPDSLERGLAESRSEANPLGLYELLSYRDISVIKGSGLGGTSLVNANVAIVPDQEVFRLAGWPAALGYDALQPYYQRARQVLDARPHPRAMQLLKVQALERRATQLGWHAEPLDLTVNFHLDGRNPYGVEQKPCTDCGDCVSGCNVGAKNTLYMNYLPMARNAGAEIYTQAQVEWIEKLPGGGWRVHGRRYQHALKSKPFAVEARNVILAAGSINSTEILMRSEMHGLPLSPRMGTAFGGNGDFFGLSYNGDLQTEVLGFGNHPESPGAARPPGPTIVAAVRYNGNLPAAERITIEDLSFPSLYVNAARAAFAVLRGEDSDTGDEAQERRRILTDLAPFTDPSPEGALNHTMLYLSMGFDDARGSMVFDAPWYERGGRMRIVWDDAGRQRVFTRINEELRRHARAQGGSFIQNPLWAMFNLRHLVTAHPLGGCPVGEDYMQGAVDEYGRVFSGDGSVHEGLLVADGALIPSALGVNPFLTICALAERIAERKVRELQGDPYPAPKVSVGVSGIDPLEVARYREAQLERLFRRAETLPLDVMVNGGAHSIDLAQGLIQNDECWKGFFPKGHALNTMSAALFTGFRKEFFRKGNRYGGITRDTDGHIRARNTLEEITLKKREGDLETGQYVLLRYVDPPWQGFYDVFKLINRDLLIGRVYLGEFPHGVRLFTFPMTRVYSLAQMMVSDHQRLWESGTVPTKEILHGSWRMDVISNANQAGGLAYLAFDHKPDGRLEARYQLMGLIEGMIMPSFAADHFRCTDFTPFRDEIRQVSTDYLVGKYVTDLPPEAAPLFVPGSLGLFHVEETQGRRSLGFYYTLTRAAGKQLPTSTLLRPFLEVHLPDGLGMTFDEEMAGWYFPGKQTGAAGRTGDLQIRDGVPPAGSPVGGVPLRFKLRMTVNDINEFIDGVAHEARATGTIAFGRFEDQDNASFEVDARRSTFQYLHVNPNTGEAEMRYHLEFEDARGRRFAFEGRKYMQKDDARGPRRMTEVLDDYTTLYAHVYEVTGARSRELGTGYLKFRTFEDLSALKSFAAFLASFRVTGTADPLLKLQAQMRFLAFTGQFVMAEYDPLTPELGAPAAGG